MDAPDDNTAAVQDQNPSVHHVPKSSKRNTRNGKQNTQHILQGDGTMSDSVTNPIATPNSKKQSRRVHGGAVNAQPTKNGAMSSKNGTKTRPISIGGGMRPATPSKEQAYAGPTFQASPAPSSLPVPKFFSPTGSRTTSHQQSSSGSFAGDKARSSGQIPEHAIASPEPPERSVQQSPLDVFFKADKAERERRRESSTLSPGIGFRRTASANETYTLPRHASANSFGQIDYAGSAETDKTKHDISSPQAQRNFAALPSQQHTPVSDDDQAVRDAYTKSLKDLLFNVTAPAPSPPASPPSHTVQFKSDARQRTSQYGPRSGQGLAAESQMPSGTDAKKQDYSLHYGDRNLSSLFKAAQNDAAQQNTTHRQQRVANHTTTVPDLAPPFFATQPTNVPSDAATVSRRYLDQTIQDFQSDNSPDSFPGAGTYHLTTANASHRPTHSNVKQSCNSTSNTTRRTSGAPDVNAMESELRRALNMNILKE